MKTSQVICLIVLVVISAIALFLMYLNSETITFDYFFGKKQLSIMSFAYCWFGLGGLFVLLYLGCKLLKLKLQNRKLRKQINI